MVAYHEITRYDYIFELISNEDIVAIPPANLIMSMETLANFAIVTHKNMAEIGKGSKNYSILIDETLPIYQVELKTGREKY